MAPGTLAHRPVFAVLGGEVAMTIAAELVKRRFRCLGQIVPGASMAVEAASGAGIVDEVVMAGDAIDGSVFLVREIGVQSGRRHSRLQQPQAADGRR